MKDSKRPVPNTGGGGGGGYEMPNMCKSLKVLPLQDLQIKMKEVQS